MTYVVFSIVGAYLVLGLCLTRYATAPNMRMKFRDVILGAAFMPVLLAFMLLCIFFEKAWKRLLVALAFDPPEEMRAGPDDEAKKDTNGQP